MDRKVNHKFAGTHSIDQAVVLFGRPKSVTGFLRTQRGGDSEIEDSFTIILQYGAPQKDLLVTVKTCITTIMSEQLKYIIRGTKGSYFKARFSLVIFICIADIVTRLSSEALASRKSRSPAA